MSHISLYAHVLVTVESFFCIVSIALAIGLTFAKFSRPSARVAYSEKMVINFLANK